MDTMNKSLLVFTFLFLFAGSLISQTGVYYYANDNIDYPNTRILSLTEANNKEIYVLGKSSSLNYDINVPYFARIDKRGNLLVQKNLKASSLFDLQELIILPNQYIQIYGSEQKAGKFLPYIKTINAVGEVKDTDINFSVYSTIINDLTTFSEDHVLVVETKLGKLEKYNINVYKFNLEENKQDWYKKISSEVNEEADQIITLKDNNIVIIGKKYNDEMTSYVPIIYKLDSEGNKIWKKGISVPENFYTHSIDANSEGRLFYTCNYSRESTGASETRVITISPNSDVLKYETLQEISANGILALSNDNFFVYGSNILVNESRVITKAKYLIIDPELNILKTHEMSNIDFPDNKFPEGLNIMPTSSDINVAIQLSDGRIACGGRIFMPQTLEADKILSSQKQNNGFLILLDDHGNF